MPRVLALLLVLIGSLSAEKRPLTHADYDGWRHIQDQQISNNGRYLAYALFPQQGDGELILRDLTTNHETREPIGELPPPPPPNYADPNEEAPPEGPKLTVRFTDDSRTLIFTTFPPRSEMEKAKREKKKPEEMPKGGLVTVDLSTGAVFRSARVKSTQVPLHGDGFIAYLHEPEIPAASLATPAPEKGADADAKPKKQDQPGRLKLRNLRTGTETTFRDVTDYTLTRDASILVFAVFAKAAETNGLYAIKSGDLAPAAALLSGKGKYTKLAWNETETRLAFLSSHDDADAKQPRFKLYDWDRDPESSALALVAWDSPGFPPNWVISEKAPVTLSKDGQLIFIGTRPAFKPEPPTDLTPADERVSADLWSWQDDYIQPMQKVRANLEHAKSYRAVYDVNARKFVQLADPALDELVPNEIGTFAMGRDDREYRRMMEYSERFADTYLIDTATGSRKLLAKKHVGRAAWSPSGKFAIYFDGKDWITLSMPAGESVNLTAALGVPFTNEFHDSPGLPQSYGMAGWTRDGRHVLLYDRFDVWSLSPDGSSAVNLTKGRKNHLSFRNVRFDFGDPQDKYIDPSKPLLLRAEDDDRHDSGFYRVSLDGSGAPIKLAWTTKSFTTPIRARDADVYVVGEQTFSEYPDLLTTDSTFAHFAKVTNANPQQAGILWGTAELVHFQSADGVPLQAILYKPEDFDPAKKYPMLVYIYERLTQGVNTYGEPRPRNVIIPSYYTSNGYLVLEPDIAYKTGYPGESALHCVLPAVQAIVDKGFVDERHIGIQGHSWGGYQIAYMVTRTNRFRAAAPGAPVADMVSAYDGIRWGPGIPRQFQYERTQSRIGGSLWEYPMRYIENSPIFMADRVTTPLLMIHNDADDAVPWYQGIEYFLALRRLNKEVYLFSYNGEPHNLRRRANQKDYTVRLQQFFDYYLKDAPKPAWMQHGIPYIEKPGVTFTDADSMASDEDFE